MSADQSNRLLQSSLYYRIAARREVERVLGPGGLNGVSSRTLHEQLSELGMIASRDPGRFTRKIWEAGRTHNVLHLQPGVLEG
jgi:hypothetical protein